MTTTVSPDAPPALPAAPAVCLGTSATFTKAPTTRKSTWTCRPHCRAEAFETSYRGKINMAGGPATAFLVAALEELERLSEQLDKPRSTPA